MIGNFFNYYGFDWLASMFAVLMIYNLGNKNPVGFYFGLSANLSWFIFSVLASSVPIFLSNIIFFTLNVRGIYKWRSVQSHKIEGVRV
jgi:nicotinamide riboside transporter PnuC